MTSLHETSRRLRLLIAHMARHPDLPEVRHLGTTYGPEDLEITVDGDGTAKFLAWCASLDQPRVRVVGSSGPGLAMLWCRGFIRGDMVQLDAHVADLPELGEWSEPMPLIGFCHVLINSGWRP
ncbi:hypothetical protein [Sciscionella marina]|uniref:hypothetical protein n=1 Tax=Sciscionella marina TaxID=508770 RepID=UPI00035DDD16|nr:hypothetical protein [Sciscionella marina]